MGLDGMGQIRLNPELRSTRKSDYMFLTQMLKGVPFERRKMEVYGMDFE